MIDKKSLAITTGSRDRLNNLRKVLPTWLNLFEPDRIVIVDWGSTPPLQDSLSDFQDSRIIIARAANQPYWNNSKCHNLEIDLADRLKCDLILRLDNDVSVNPDFFDVHPIDETCFYAVDCHSVPRELDDKRNLCGTVFTHVKHFLQVGGYNERLTNYGYEDEDVYQRLRKLGLQWRPCDINTLDHIPHGDDLRFKNLSAAKHLDKIKHGLAPDQSVKDYLIAMSKHSATSRPWTSADSPTRWNVNRSGNRHWDCQEGTPT